MRYYGTVGTLQSVREANRYRSTVQNIARRRIIGSSPDCWTCMQFLVSGTQQAMPALLTRLCILRSTNY